MSVQKSKYSRDFKFFVFVVPVLFALSILSLIFLERVAARNSRVCQYLGKIWLEGVPSDPSVRNGCFTYDELFE